MIKQFALKLALLIPIPAIVLGFNWFVDPVHLKDPGQYERGIAQLVLDGKNVTNIWHPDEAAYMAFYINGLQTRKDVIVLGSSRSKLVRSDAFPGLSFFNNSISGAGLVDYLAIYEIYRQRNLMPSMVVLELSPWILMRNHSSIWKSLNAHKTELEKYMLYPSLRQDTSIAISGVTPTDLAEFLSLGYFQTSFYTWLRRIVRPAENKAVYFEYHEGTLPLGETLLADGSAIYPERIQDATEKERILALAIEYGQNPAGVPDALDPGRRQVLEAFVDYLLRSNVRVVFYLPPYHPKAYEIMVNSTRYRIIIQEQQYFEMMAQQKGVTIIGSYNPSDVGFDSAAFFDGSHPTAEAVQKMFVGRVPSVQARQPSTTGKVDEIGLVGIQNLNGFEAVNGKPFFWIGQGETCLSVRSTRAGSATLTLQAVPGPSLPETPRRTFYLNTSSGYTSILTVSTYPTVTLILPVVQGLDQVCIKPLDQPTKLEQPNGDKRPLLMGVLDSRIQLLPEGTTCLFNLSAGWYSIEQSGADWIRWTDGRGIAKVTTGQEMGVALSGEIISVQRPNAVDILLNGNKVAAFSVEWLEWQFRPFAPLALKLKKGENNIEFVSHNTAITLPTDGRSLAIAVKNLRLHTADGQLCELQP